MPDHGWVFSVQVMFTFGFLLATSRNMPFKDEVANKFKLATECALMITCQPHNSTCVATFGDHAKVTGH